jgi:hypothetical protein
VRVVQDPEVLNQVDLGFSRFSDQANSVVEESEYAQGEGKPRMH